MPRAWALSQILTSHNVNLTPGSFRTWWGADGRQSGPNPLPVWREELLKPVAPGKGMRLESGKGDWDVMEFEYPFIGTTCCVRGDVRRVRATDLQSLGEEAENEVSHGAKQVYQEF